MSSSMKGRYAPGDEFLPDTKIPRFAANYYCQMEEKLGNVEPAMGLVGTS